MVDFKGNELKAGDHVVYIRKTYCTSCLATGTIEKIKKMFGNEQAVISGAYHSVMPQSIYKLS